MKRLASVLISTLVWGCGVGSVSSLENPEAEAPNRLVLVRQGQKMRLSAALADPSYSAEYPNPTGLERMEVKVLSNGELVTRCQGATSTSVCNDPPFFVGLTRTPQGNLVRLYDTYDVMVAQFSFYSCDAAPPAAGGGSNELGVVTPCPVCEDGDGNDDGAEGDAPGKAPNSGGRPGNTNGECVETPGAYAAAKERFVYLVNEKLRQYGIRYTVDVANVSDNFGKSNGYSEAPVIEQPTVGCHADIALPCAKQVQSEYGAATGACGDFRSLIRSWESSVRKELTVKGYCNKTPLLLDLGGDGIELTSVRDGVDFDLLGNGQPVRTAWSSGNDAWLVLDSNRNGKVDGAQELFGNVTGGRTYADGFAAIAELDRNKDGRMDKKDKAFKALRLWTDRNHDGKSAPGELRSLAAAGIRALELEPTRLDDADSLDMHGNRIPLLSRFVRTDGSKGMFVDAYLRFEPLTLPMPLASQR